MMFPSRCGDSCEFCAATHKSRQEKFPRAGRCAGSAARVAAIVGRHRRHSTKDRGRHEQFLRRAGFPARFRIFSGSFPTLRNASRPPGRAGRGRHAALLGGTVAAVALLLLAGRAPEPVAGAAGAAPALSRGRRAGRRSSAPRPPRRRRPPPRRSRPSGRAALARVVAAPPRRPAQPTVDGLDAQRAAAVDAVTRRPVLASVAAAAAGGARRGDGAHRRAGARRRAGRCGGRQRRGGAGRWRRRPPRGRPQPRRPLPRPARRPAGAGCVVASLSPAPAEMALAARSRPAGAARAPRPRRSRRPPRAARRAPRRAPRSPRQAGPAVKAVRAPAPVRKAAPVGQGATQAPARRPTRAATVPVAKVATQAPCGWCRCRPRSRRCARSPPPRHGSPRWPRRSPTPQRRQPPGHSAAAKPAQPQRTAARRPATERAGLSRGNVSLIGVFGGEDGRHALLLLPDGSIERVRAGRPRFAAPRSRRSTAIRCG